MKLFSIILLLIAGTANATSYYISPSGSNTDARHHQASCGRIQDPAQRRNGD